MHLVDNQCYHRLLENFPIPPVKFGSSFVFSSRYISINELIQIVMGNFIEDYLNSPSQAITTATDVLRGMTRFDLVDEDIVYQQLATPEFRLYEEILVLPS